MRRTFAKPFTLPRFRVSRAVKGFFALKDSRPPKENLDSIFSLACQRCAGFTTRPKEREEQDY